MEITTLNYLGDSLLVVPTLPDKISSLVIADPPYFNIQNEDWDKDFTNESSYLEWTMEWIEEIKPKLTDNGLLIIFGQIGKKEQVFLPLMNEARKLLHYHDLLIWDRVVGYDRRDSFFPAYEMALVLRKGGRPYFSDEVRIPYSEEVKKRYMVDKRYKDLEKRRDNLEKGKGLTNILSIPSLRGKSKEKCGHPTQKPERLIEVLIRSYSEEGDTIIDPFAGAFTVAKVAKELNRSSISIEKDEDYFKIGEKRLL